MRLLVYSSNFINLKFLVATWDFQIDLFKSSDLSAFELLRLLVREKLEESENGVT